MIISILAWAPAAIKNPTYMRIFINLLHKMKNAQVIASPHQVETQCIQVWSTMLERKQLAVVFTSKAVFPPLCLSTAMNPINIMML